MDKELLTRDQAAKLVNIKARNLAHVKEIKEKIAEEIVSNQDFLKLRKNIAQNNINPKIKEAIQSKLKTITLDKEICDLYIPLNSFIVGYYCVKPKYFAVIQPIVKKYEEQYPQIANKWTKKSIFNLKLVNDEIMDDVEKILLKKWKVRLIEAGYDVNDVMEWKLHVSGWQK